MSAFGKLFLLPSPLFDDCPAEQVLPGAHREKILHIRHAVGESPKPARKWLKALGFPLPEMQLELLNEHSEAKTVPGLLKPCVAGLDMLLLSDAGCPGVADPGAAVVAEAHKKGVVVVPLTGPSSILLLLMASGFNGQRFSFHGYLPIDAPQRKKAFRDLEAESKRHNQTQVWIETPYRNTKMLGEALESLHGDTLLAIGIDLQGPTETIMTKPVHVWRSRQPELHKRLAVFALFAGRL